MVLGIGILSGLYPAWRAARVRPLESIRSEGE
jgi:ABC-type antimicrobial peptide transport system permease subunit